MLSRRRAPVLRLRQAGQAKITQYTRVSLLIMAGVGLVNVKQIQSQLEQHSYEGFLR